MVGPWPEWPDRRRRHCNKGMTRAGATVMARARARVVGQLDNRLSNWSCITVPRGSVKPKILACH